MTRYRVTYKGRMTRTFVNRTAGNVLYDVWSAYREWLVGPTINVNEKTSTAIAATPITTAMFDVVYTKDVETDILAQAVSDFVDTGQIAMVIPLAFDPDQILIEEIKE